MKIRTLSSAISLGALMAALPSAVLAQNDDLSYSYIEASYHETEVDMYEDDDMIGDFVEDNLEGEGYGIEISMEAGEYFFIFGGYDETDTTGEFVNDVEDALDLDTDLKTLNVGLGFHAPLASGLDFVGRASYIDVDIGEFSLGAEDQDVVGGDDSVEDAIDDLNEDSSDGYALDAGLRGQALSWLELGGGLRYVELDAGDDTQVYGNALLELSPAIGVSLQATSGDEVALYEVGVRFSF